MKYSLAAYSIRRKLNLWITISAMLFVGCNRSTYIDKSNAAQILVEEISKALSERTVGRVEIVQIPPRILTTARVTTDMLEKGYYNKLIIRNIASTAYQNKLVDSFRSIIAQPRSDTADLRWGVIFYARDDVRVGAVYFDKFGHNGLVNDMPASLTGDFFKWLNSTFSDCLQ